MEGKHTRHIQKANGSLPGPLGTSEVHVPFHCNLSVLQELAHCCRQAPKGQRNWVGEFTGHCCFPLLGEGRGGNLLNFSRKNALTDCCSLQGTTAQECSSHYGPSSSLCLHWGGAASFPVNVAVKCLGPPAAGKLLSWEVAHCKEQLLRRAFPQP